MLPDYDPKKDLYLNVKLQKLVKVEDWYKDGSTMVRTLRSGGKGRSAYSDSTIILRLKIDVNGEQIYSNYPADAAPDFDNLRQMSQDERKEHLQNPDLLTLRIDDYTLPSLIIKLIKSMKKNQKSEMTTTRIDKLHKNFASPFLDQYKAFKEGDLVKITCSLYSLKNTSYFYKLKVAEKLWYVERMKAKAGDFFKQGNLAKAAKIYQKINGYYNFGDVNNNYTKEEGADFDEVHKKLVALKQLCF